MTCLRSAGLAATLDQNLSIALSRFADAVPELAAETTRRVELAFKLLEFLRCRVSAEVPVFHADHLVTPAV